jgi:hypothetical protein
MKNRKKNSWTLLVAGILLLFGVFFFNCRTGYAPALYPSYDVLNPGEKVRMNPLEIREDGNLIVNPEFMLWVLELKNEILKLRKKGS